MPKISVIVPAYNVEKYIEKSIGCLLKQTFKDFEVLLIDDGSTDLTAELCDKLASQDSRIKVYHKQNGGVSDSRNYGLDRMSGEFMTFVDSDDLISDDYLEYLYSLIIRKDNVQIAMTRGQAINEVDDPRPIAETENYFVSAEDAVRKMMLRQEFGHANWGKLYKSSLWDNVRFPIDVIYDDYDTTYRVFSLARNVVCGNACKYFYVQRRGSLMHAQCSERTLSVLDVADNITNFMIKTWPNCKIEAIDLQISTYLKNMQEILNTGFNSFPEYQKRIRKKVKDKAFLLIKSSRVPKKDKVKIISFLLGKKIFLTIYNLNDGNVKIKD